MNVIILNQKRKTMEQKLKIYIASSWRHQHAVEMLTAQLRANGSEVTSWIENNYKEGMTATGALDFEEWVNSDSAEKAFKFDTNGAFNCDLFIYLGNGGKDAMAECGICYARNMKGENIPMYALYQKGEDLGLMRKMFYPWFNRVTDLLDFILDYSLKTTLENGTKTS